jgi:ubiquinone/menaquinone biosynthesis C-methylase UbiE
MEYREHVQPIESAPHLDSRFRRVFQDPARTLKGRVKEGMVVLELGCGPGFFTPEIGRAVGRSGKVIAADLQQGFLDILGKKIKGTEIEKRVELHKCEEGVIGVTEKVDLVLAFFMLHQIADPKKALEEIKSMLKRDGQLYIVEFKSHPPRKYFDEMVEMARDVGFTEVERPKFLISRAIVLK